jgi:hypothetical protein
MTENTRYSQKRDEKRNINQQYHAFNGLQNEEVQL